MLTNQPYQPKRNNVDTKARMRNMKVAAGQFTVTEKPEHNISIISGFTSERHAIMHGYCCCRKV